MPLPSVAPPQTRSFQPDSAKLSGAAPPAPRACTQSLSRSVAFAFPLGQLIARLPLRAVRAPRCSARLDTGVHIYVPPTSMLRWIAQLFRRSSMEKTCVKTIAKDDLLVRL